MNTLGTGQADYDLLAVDIQNGTHDGRPIKDVDTQRFVDALHVVVAYADEREPPTSVYAFDANVDVSPDRLARQRQQFRWRSL